jgi:hypothetical protein
MGRGAAIVLRADLPYGRTDAVCHGARTHRYIVHATVILDKRRATSHKHVRLDDDNHSCHNDASIKQPGSINVARSKLSNQQVIEIRKRAKEGVTAREMARELLVSAETVRRVVRMETHLMVEVGQELEAALKG